MPLSGLALIREARSRLEGDRGPAPDLEPGVPEYQGLFRIHGDLAQSLAEDRFEAGGSPNSHCIYVIVDDIPRPTCIRASRSECWADVLADKETWTGPSRVQRIYGRVCFRREW